VFVPAATNAAPGVSAAGMDGASGTDQRRLFVLAAQYGVQVRHLRPSVPTLEDVFAKAVGQD
jgi:hypothetical protein